MGILEIAGIIISLVTTFGPKAMEAWEDWTAEVGPDPTPEQWQELRDKIKAHNKSNPQESQKATLGMLKAVWRRGAGAFSVGTPG